VGKVYAFPSPEDRAQIKDAIAACANWKISQNTMNCIIANVLQERRIKKLVVENFIVRYIGNIITLAGVFPVVTIKATQKAAGDACPACGHRGGGYLRGDEVMTVFCNRCGGVYEVEAEAIG